MSNFNLQNFYRFCNQLRIETKEKGLVKMTNLLGTQTYVMNEIAQGLKEGVHHFVILKGRQLGITTVSLALDLYWSFTNPGLQSSLVTIRKRTGICSAPRFPCTWTDCPRNIASP